MKSKKIYAMFLSTAIAATTCVYASDPKSRPLPCSAAPGSMLGAPDDQSEHTQSRLEGSKETPANTIEGFDHAATPNSPEPQSASLSAAPTKPAASNVKHTNDIETEERTTEMLKKKWLASLEKYMTGACHEEENEQVALPSGLSSAALTKSAALNVKHTNDIRDPYYMAFQTLNEIRDYIRRNKGTTDENSMKRWIEGKLPFGEKLPFADHYEYDAPRMNWTNNYYYAHHCRRNDVIDNLLRFFKYGTFNSDDTYKCLNDIIACIIWNASESIRQTESVASKSGAQPQTYITTLRLPPPDELDEIINERDHLPQYEYLLAMRKLFISPSASLSSVDPAFTRRLKGSLA